MIHQSLGARIGEVRKMKAPLFARPVRFAYLATFQIGFIGAIVSKSLLPHTLSKVVAAGIVMVCVVVGNFLWKRRYSIDDDDVDIIPYVSAFETWSTLFSIFSLVSLLSAFSPSSYHLSVYVVLDALALIAWGLSEVAATKIGARTAPGATVS
jgi:hypothetical protein